MNPARDVAPIAAALARQALTRTDGVPIARLAALAAWSRRGGRGAA